ncbi:aldo/keto reductase [Aggregicoccus sp. 17bor-14]|uniref:aldo/keto reductase n=1 Tax=Myxococcaceae TaxID=31 RepID=UPI00129CF02E|nr:MULTISPECIES: aldo/keto reductase [Myxococcaceae]MBF5043085.1 aldo/keto reductase [Simulacricoccus sp. 17bor-14]MRI88848.1 aldo/keto reductase [Aggregicoccus sp. 17bor-14]
MLTRPIPRTREPLPVLGLGTWQTFDVGATSAEREPLRAVLTRFLDAGGRLVDSSPMYGRAEAVVGEELRQLGRAQEAFLATKVWTSGKEAGRAQIETSERLMGALDLVQVHNLLDWEVQLATLRELKAQGRIRYVGVTHYQLSAFAQLERLLRTEHLDFIQLPYSVGVREAEARLLPAAQDTGTAVLVMRPFEGGELLRRMRGTPVPEWARAELQCESWAQLFLKFLLGHPAVNCPLPATSNPAHLEDNLAAGRGPLPDAAQRARILGALGL